MTEAAVARIAASQNSQRLNCIGDGGKRLIILVLYVWRRLALVVRLALRHSFRYELVVDRRLVLLVRVVAARLLVGPHEHAEFVDGAV